MVLLPKHYERFVTTHGGKVDGHPRFLLRWGGPPFPECPIPDDLLLPYRDHWTLWEWQNPREFGLKEEWPFDSKPFPSHGGYMSLAQFRHEVPGPPPRKEPDALDSKWLNMDELALHMWLHLSHLHDTLEQRARVMKDAEAIKEERKVKKIADMLQNAFPEFGDACSFSGQRNVNSALKQKMELIERSMKVVRDFRRRVPKGMTINPRLPGMTAGGLYLP